MITTDDLRIIASDTRGLRADDRAAMREIADAYDTLQSLTFKTAYDLEQARRVNLALGERVIELKARAKELEDKFAKQVTSMQQECVPFNVLKPIGPLIRVALCAGPVKLAVR